jgi:hypothetical protein
MKYTMTKLIAVFAVSTVMAGGSVYAQAPATGAQNHEAHHSESQAPAKTGDMGTQGGMMGSMKMDDMMTKREANMKKGDCQKMMKKAKTQEKKEKTNM